MAQQLEQGEPRPFPFHVAALAASAGSLAALSMVLSGLPADLPAALVVVQHLDSHYESLMPKILERRSTLHVKQAEDGEALDQDPCHRAVGVVLLMEEEAV
jgi:chemotaxis response regulator CheB